MSDWPFIVDEDGTEAGPAFASGKDDEDELEDRLGFLYASEDGNDLVLTRKDHRGDEVGLEVLRYDRVNKLLRITPRMMHLGQLDPQFRQVTELQIEAPAWDPSSHSAESERFGLLYVRGLRASFRAVYAFGLGIKRDYIGLIEEIEENTPCTVIRFVDAGPEGVDTDGITYRVSMQRFDDFCAAVHRSRDRGNTAVRRVIDAERHNAVADLFGLERIEPKYGRNPIIRAITEEVTTGHVTEAGDRALLVDEVARAAPVVVREAPERFSQLRDDIQLVSLEALIERFENDLSGSHARDEPHWQRFFSTNQFALQMVFSTPIVVARPQAHVQSPDLSGGGSRISDFLCANAVTRTAVVVEIKTPSTELMAAKPYRGKGAAAAYPPHTKLSGAVAQVQSQMAAVPQDLAWRLHRERDLELDPWHDVRGAVIAGRVSTLADARLDSFHCYRAGLATVTVLCYDEVLERLKALHKVLKTPPTSAEPTT